MLFWGSWRVVLTMQTNILCPLTIGLGLALSAPAQVKTEVPEVVPSAKPATVEHIKIHGIGAPRWAKPSGAADRMAIRNLARMRIICGPRLDLS